MIDEALLETVRTGGPAIMLERACWLAWPSETRPGISAAMSSAQFVHFNAPVLAVQRNGQMEYFNEKRRRRWSSNLAWPRANLEMARLPARADFTAEHSSAETSFEENPHAEDALGEDALGEDAPVKNGSGENGSGQDAAAG